MDARLVTRQLVVCVLVMGCSSAHPAKVSQAQRSLSPEEAKATLVELIRSSPGTFEVKFDPEEYAAKPLKEQGQGSYSLGWFGIHLPGSVYRLTLTPKPDSFAACIVDYEGEFVFEDGHWVARKPHKVSYGKIR